MYFLLHHSTGTLVFAAADRSDVLSWTVRQLGDAAARAALVEVADHLVSDWVEKSGTGFKRSGCEALFSVMADSVQLVGGSASSASSNREDLFAQEIKSRKSTVH
jgi:hypothetical protein